MAVPSLAEKTWATGCPGVASKAIPVLAGLTAYAVSELYGWKTGLSHGFHEAKGFWRLIVAATGIETVIGSLEVEPIRTLMWIGPS